MAISNVTGSVQITAESEEVAKMAREMLEKNSITVKVPHNMAGRIIGTQGGSIQVSPSPTYLHTFTRL